MFLKLKICWHFLELGLFETHPGVAATRKKSFERSHNFSYSTGFVEIAERPNAITPHCVSDFTWGRDVSTDTADTMRRQEKMTAKPDTTLSAVDFTQNWQNTTSRDWSNLGQLTNVPFPFQEHRVTPPPSAVEARSSLALRTSFFLTNFINFFHSFTI